MKALGKMNTLEVLRFTSVGAYINAQDESSDTDVLLPNKYIPGDVAIGDMIDVFLYRDSEDRLIATTMKPALQVGEIGVLKVTAISEIGAYLSWGLEKDLFIPHREQVGQLGLGQRVVVRVYIDKTDRLAATMRIEKSLSTSHAYKTGDTVKGTVYKFHKEIGAFVAVDNLYMALIPIRECFGDLKAGTTVEARITKIHDDGKIDLAVRAPVATQIHDDVADLMHMLEEAGGYLPYNDKTDPEIIKEHFKMSKRAFKRALGVLLKDEKIVFEKDGFSKK